ncbi:pyridoxal phosphate-dependent aminotransferase [Acidipila sp. EB88]|uniref:pyridoxal phosphate-dependent aminotransferase n=1 Tax=Acidipila sp. EB88 TaxID=2305226 RepID=UPI000F5F6F76|nr:pyridoxal phosphate-dependent aminotransferase [Acidipila sp. EB88]RRA48134.1 aminotransferase class I/II-fold pyridoxal phosphate-dependent enzyme [Acidipila sp. EB88]
MPISRRNFLRTAAAGTAAVATLPLLSEAHLAMAQRRTPRKADPAGSVRIDANENPLGPCAAACTSISGLIPEGGRYDSDLTGKLAEIFAAQEGLKPEYVSVYAGSSEPLHYSVLAFTSASRAYVTGDPGYEAGMLAAALNGAEVKKVPLTPTHAHDAKAMLAAAPMGGVFYICNPNNPTGTTTPREQIEYALANKPAGSILLIDEAYIHFSDAASAIDLVKADKDVIVLRTFSKLYGMAGIRCGLAIGRPDLLAKIAYYGMNPMPIMAVAAATASLRDPGIIAQRKAINAQIRTQTFEWLTANNYKFIPSESNCFMIDTGRPGHAVMSAMASENVYIGRVWPIMPTSVRITVGTAGDMAQFQTAFKKVMSAPAVAFTGPMPGQNRSRMLS